VLGESKEGVLGIRVARSLEQPSKTPDIFTDAQGKATKDRVVNNEGVNGEYLGSDGKTGDAVWATRGPWTMLRGKVESEPVTLAILDHPANPGFPTYWHARGYGLFAANNLGQNAFDPKQPEVKRTIKPGESMTFRHRVLILNGTADAARLAAEHKTFSQQK
jgi:Methane oxygenase PmoA